MKPAYKVAMEIISDINTFGKIKKYYGKYKYLYIGLGRKRRIFAVVSQGEIVCIVFTRGRFLSFRDDIYNLLIRRGFIQI